jgi:hypothetical protein
MWVYQLREGELRLWLEGPGKVSPGATRGGLVSSPVDEVEGIPRYDIRVFGPEILSQYEYQNPEEPAPEKSPRGGFRYNLYADPGPYQYERGYPADDAAAFDREPVEEGPPEAPTAPPIADEPGDGAVPGPVDDSGQTDGPDASAGEEGSMVLYTVAEKDSLCKIARNLLGAERRWKEIQALNKDLLRGSTVIQPGMKLLIPAR